MKIGDIVCVPKYYNVKIEDVFSNRKEAEQNGYKESTHYCDNTYGILGKYTDTNNMIFAAFKL